MTFGQHLRAARKAKGLTQQAVADALHVSKAYVSQVETGTRSALNERHTQAIAIVFRMPLKTVAAWLEAERCVYCGARIKRETQHA